jgi:PAS domain S-box-containing protein/diguanylate cyclase (GGDEF)-like protein
MGHMNDQPETDGDILVVEDSETQANQLAHLLRSNGYQVRVANNGRAGLVAARLARPTLVVSDIVMPELDGFEMCRALKKDPLLNGVPVILLTSLTSLYDVIKGLDCGADSFIRKPFEGKYLLARIRYILLNRVLRSNEKVQLGMQIHLGGKTHFVTAERQQIFDLLISTYEEAIQMTEELRAQQNQIARSYQSLEGLYRIAEALNPAITEKDVAEKALARALDLPGVTGGCLKLLDLEGKFRTQAAQDFGADADPLAECLNCTCQGRLISGELRTPEIINDCAMLQQASAKHLSSSMHVSVPLTVGERTLGVMNLLGADDTVFKDEDFQVLSTVGNQIAIALERANLYTNMEMLINERTIALTAERNLLSNVMKTTGALVILVDPTGRIVAFNPACERCLGWSFEEVKGRFYWDVFLPPNRIKFVKEYFDDLSSSQFTLQMQEEWITRSGAVRHIIWSTSPMKRPDQTIEYFVGSGIDVTELRLAEEKIRYLSNFDLLTGLPNRILLRDRVKLVQEKIVAGREVMGFLVVHFERLPLIRESLGEKAEHALLLEMTNRLKGWAKADDSVARFGDSSFGIVAVRQGPGELSGVAGQLLSILDQPFLFEQQDFHLEASIGITIFPNDDEDFDALSQGAEAAMRRALASKTARYEFYTPELNRGANERFKLESALRRALERDELLLYYQPQLDLRTGRIIGLEALLRWQHPELGFIPPGHFIGLAEETGLILPIGEWVLRKACEQNREWQQAGLSNIPVAVNLSAKQFSSNIPGKVREILDQTGLSPTLLELELTETVSMDDPENTIEILRTLKDTGVGLSIDDFGTGYSNLSYLKRFPVDKLKLDQSFVRDLTSDPDDLAISRAVIAMAHSLRLKVLAEGVETEGQLALLMENDCDEMQGYIFSRPVDAATCAGLLREGKALALDRFGRTP